MHDFVKCLKILSVEFFFGDLQMVKLIWYKLTGLIMPNLLKELI